MIKVYHQFKKEMILDNLHGSDSMNYKALKVELRIPVRSFYLWTALQLTSKRPSLLFWTTYSADSRLAKPAPMITKVNSLHQTLCMHTLLVLFLWQTLTDTVYFCSTCFYLYYLTQPLWNNNWKYLDTMPTT